jgi:hypothetical protein
VGHKLASLVFYAKVSISPVGTSKPQEGEMRISKVSAREVTDTMRLLYWQASKKGKAEQAKVLDHLVAATGYHRKYAIRLLNHPPQLKPKKHRQRQRIYTVKLIQPLTFIWEICGHICSKRLKPFLPEIADILERLHYLHLSAQDRQLLATISHSTMDRLLATAHHRFGSRGRSMTKPGTLLSETEAARRPRGPSPSVPLLIGTMIALDSWKWPWLPTAERQPVVTICALWTPWI